MRKKFLPSAQLYLAAVAGVAVLAGACGQGAVETTEITAEPGVTEPPPIDDATITAEIESKLNTDPDLEIFTVEVETADNVVTLRGEVESEEARATAEAGAADTLGVEQVNNELEVVAAGKAKGRISDAWITTKVKSKLAADPQVNPFNIDVDTKNRIVTLSGTVATETARAEAEKHALDTRAVRSVVNKVEVEPAEKEKVA